MTMVLAAILCLLPGAEAERVRPFPRVEAIPLPYHQLAFEIGGVEIARYHYGPDVPKPYLFPFIGPAGRRLTRLTHPHDPVGHGHHLSVWVGHQNVAGVNFWELNPAVRITHERVERIEDGDDRAALVVVNAWRDADGRALMSERRTLALTALEGDERYLDVTLEFSPADGDVELGKTPFGFLAVRVAKTMSVNDGGGLIVNSEGDATEKNVLWKRARWVDYTGPVTADERNGIAFFDHPGNPRFPTGYHVRSDGWMGASFCLEEPYTLAEGAVLRLRYRLYAHDGRATPETIDEHWRRFADTAGED